MNAEDYGEGGDFEYEAEDTSEAEDTEAGDEGFEADEADEGDESVYEADEADEGDEADEADEAVPMFEADEADEADEGDEADEAVDEAIRLSASARYRQERARRRQERYAQRVALSQRRDAIRAAASQRALQSRIRAIPLTRRTRVATVGALQGAGVVTAILPNGRRTRMRIVPTVAPISEVNRLRSVVITNERRQAAAIATNAKAVSSLASAQSAAVKRLTEQQLRSDKDLGRKLVEGHNRLDARITKELSGGSGIIDRHGKRMVAVLRRERRRALMNNVLLATSVPFFVAYGDRDSPFTVDNAIIAGSTLFWLVGDDVISSWAANKGFVQGLASVWSYGAPVANGAGLYFWFRKKQNQRFVAGITKVPVGGSLATPVDIKGLLKKFGKYGSDDFAKKQHTVVATLVNGNAVTNGTVRASLTTDGKLTLSLDPVASSPLNGTVVDVAWLVDTAGPTEAVEA
jgi:hypothetical protein